MRVTTLLAASFVVCAQQTSQQQPEPFRIEGTVRDLTGGQPIVNARVFVRGARPGAAKANQPAAHTGPDGSFSVVVDAQDRYLVTVQADGYLGESEMSQIVKLTSASRSATTSITLVRPASITGRVTDEDTGKPVSGIRIFADVPQYQHGRRVITRAGDRVITNATGEFHIGDLLPDDYVLTLAPEQGKVTVREGQEPRDAPVSRGYVRQWWPGGVNIEQVSTFPLTAGVNLQLPDIRIARQPLYRVHGAIEVRNCEDKQPYKLHLTERFGPAAFLPVAQGTLPCQSRFTVGPLWPGNYNVRTTADSPTTLDRPSAHQEFTLHAGDTDLFVSPAPPVIISGRVIYPDGFPAAAKQSLKVDLSKVSAGDGFYSIRQAKGLTNFEAFVCPGADYQVRIAGLRLPHYVSKITFNGAEVEDGIVTPGSYAAGQSVEVTISENPATLRGKAVSDGKPAFGASVILVPWPLRHRDGFPVYRVATADGDGQYEFAGVVPGTYHVLSMPSRGWRPLHKPGVLATLAAQAQRVTLVPGAVSNLAIGLVGISAGR